jgi:hypothetical protein
MPASCHRARSPSSGADAPALERRVDLGLAEPHRAALAAEETEAGKLTALETIEDGCRRQAEMFAELAGGE